MSRISYADDEEWQGQFALWQANCDRSMRGKRGQKFLRELEAALVAMPEKRLISHALVEPSGEVCAIGALARQRGVLPAPPPAHEFHGDDDQTDDFAVEHLDAPRMVAWAVVAENDFNNERYFYATCEGPIPNRSIRQEHDYNWHGHYDGDGYYYYAGYRAEIRITPEIRYERVLAWVRSKLAEVSHVGR